MPAKDLGTKWNCFKCGTKFYDLKKPDPVCPKCGANPQDSPALKPSTSSDKKRAPREVVEAPVAVKAEAEAGEEEVDAEDDAPPPDEAAEEEDLDA
jgi:uncharacterized protein (TIGR02300 family)